MLSLEAEKAFDRLSWQFLCATLQHVGIEGNFLNAVRALYSSLTVSVKLCHAMSLRFKFYNDMRQGCPLSPLLFALYIEPLANAILGNPNIKQVATKGKQFNISLYTDDVLL